MALSTYEEIKAQVLDEIEQLKESAYPEDLLREFADSETPIYYSDIIEEWGQMPSEYCDEWQQIGAGKDSTITSLMQIDLLLYYEMLFLRAWEEVEAANV